MAIKKDNNNNTTYDELSAQIKSGGVRGCYIFHGPEQYLLWDSLSKIRALLCPHGLDSFNYKRFEAGKVDIEALEEAVEVMPFMTEKTLVEVHEYSIFRGGENERERLCGLISDLPGHVCLIFVYSASEFKLADKRQKITKAVLNHAQIVEFAAQDEKRLQKWVIRHFNDAGCDISAPDAAYLVQITDGLMTAMSSEIEKVAAYTGGRTVRRSDIDAVVLPGVNAVVYKLTDAIVRRNFKNAMQVLDELLQMQEAPHKLLFSISLKMRQLFAARVCIESKAGKAGLMAMCGIYSDYPAQILMDTARKTTLSYCRSAVLMCAQTAKELNSMREPEARIIELVGKLAVL